MQVEEDWTPADDAVIAAEFTREWVWQLPCDTRFPLCRDGKQPLPLHEVFDFNRATRRSGHCLGVSLSAAMSICRGVEGMRLAKYVEHIYDSVGM